MVKFEANCSNWEVRQRTVLAGSPSIRIVGFDMLMVKDAGLLNLHSSKPPQIRTAFVAALDAASHVFHMCVHCPQSVNARFNSGSFDRLQGPKGAHDSVSRQSDGVCAIT